MICDFALSSLTILISYGKFWILISYYVKFRTIICS